MSVPAAQAATTDCSASDATLSCRLTGVLHWLDAAAILLVLVLLAVIGIAIYVYRKNRADHPEHR
ncbi:MAG TPA: hypothetical protein VIJ65_03750 [Acidobacteriaceae bacterium]